MKNNSLLLVSMMLSTSLAFSQLRVENDGSLYVNSSSGDWGRSNWTKVHYKYSCAYHLFSTFHNMDMFYVRGDGYTWAVSGYLTGSDRKFKTNVSNINSSLNIIKNLRGVKYNLTHLPDSDIEFGLIAQEVEEVIPEVVKTMHDSSKAIAYSNFIPILIEAAKELNDKIDQLENQLSICCSSNERVFPEKSENTPYLMQNNPNPFNTETQIQYYLGNDTKNASIVIFDMQGKLIVSKNLTATPGNGNIKIQAKELSPGMYMYSLIVDQKEVDTKRMILTE